MPNYTNFDQKDDLSGFIARVVDTDTKQEIARFDIPITEGRSRKELEKAVEKRLNPPPAPVVTPPTVEEIARADARDAYKTDLRLVRQYQSAALVGVDVTKVAEYVDALARLQSGFKPEYAEMF